MKLEIGVLLESYRNGTKMPAEIVEEIYSRISRRGPDGVWISLVPKEQALARARALEAGPMDLPLYGIPFAIKDNIDLAEIPTTAGCPDFSYVPTDSATAVALLLAAGAIPIGKTNLDQFATGLVGVRSPYGIPRSVFGGDLISGGSSSGSAVSVAAGLCAFSLGTDTAGSGRIPAAFNELVGLKPTRGWISAHGVVPACQSLDCVSIFANSVSDAAMISAVIGRFDVQDPYARRKPVTSASFASPPRIGIPSELEFFGNEKFRAAFQKAVEKARSLGWNIVEVDFRPFRETAELLYGGPWVAERVSAISEFFATHRDSLFPVTRTIYEGEKKFTAKGVFTSLHRLEELRRLVEPSWNTMDALLVPSAANHPTVAEVEADPLRLNSQLGYYTNFANFLDLCAMAVPAGRTTENLPFGITLLAPAWQDGALANLTRQWLGEEGSEPAAVGVELAVVGAHLRGLPLHGQLTDLAAQFVEATRTAPFYKLHALPGTVPPKPGMLRVEQGVALEVEVYRLSLEAFGGFVAAVPSPLCIGSVTLESGRTVKGFLCEAAAVKDAPDISHFGGWRAYQQSL